MQIRENEERLGTEILIVYLLIDLSTYITNILSIIYINH